MRWGGETTYPLASRDMRLYRFSHPDSGEGAGGRLGEKERLGEWEGRKNEREKGS